MIRMLLIGYLYGIRSETHGGRVARDHLADDQPSRTAS